MQDLLERSVRGDVKANCLRINVELYDQRVDVPQVRYIASDQVKLCLYLYVDI